MPKIYTKTGDNGTTFCPPFGVVSKSHYAVVAQGDLDELNSWIGMVRSHYPSSMGSLFYNIQSNLLKLGADISGIFESVESETYNNKMIKIKDVVVLEEKIDELSKYLPPLKNFILPCEPAEVHVARSVCRRAERSLVAYGDKGAMSGLNVLEVPIKYLNRLSDFLFVFARSFSQRQDEIWKGKQG